MEKWTNFIYCTHFKISNTGRLINTRTNHERKLSMQSGGYLGFTLFRGKKSYAMHRCVAEHFIPKPTSNEKLVVNHKDCNKLNNTVSNLEWITWQENVNHASLNGRISKGEKRYGSKISESDALNIKNRGLSGEKISSIMEDYKISYSTIRNIIIGKKWKHLN